MNIQNGYYFAGCCIPIFYGVWSCLKRRIYKQTPQVEPVKKVDESAKKALLALTEAFSDERPITPEPEIKKLVESLKIQEVRESLKIQEVGESLNSTIEGLWHRLNENKPKTFFKKLVVGNTPIHAHKIQIEGCSTEFIASVAPSSILSPELFWKGVIQYKFPMVIDLTGKDDLKPNEDDTPEVHAYYPATNLDTQVFKPAPLNFDSVTLTQKAPIAIKTSGFWEHIYEVSAEKDAEPEKITRLHYPQWDDGTAITLENLIKLITYMKSQKEDRFWVHCRSGYGRTGTLITAFFLAFFIENKKITLEIFPDALVALIIDLRKMRGVGFVWKKEQFALLYNYGMHLLTEVYK